MVGEGNILVLVAERFLLECSEQAVIVARKEIDDAGDARYTFASSPINKNEAELCLALCQAITLKSKQIDSLFDDDG